MRSHLLSGCLLLLALLLELPAAAGPGLVKVSCDKGTEVRIQVSDENGKTIFSDKKTDTGNDGTVEFGLEDKIERQAKTVYVCKQSDGKTIWYTLKFKPFEVNLASLEPFEFPTFTTALDATLLTSVSIKQLLDQGVPFSQGQALQVTDGSILPTETLLFKNASGLTENDILQLTDATFANLPNFNGPVTVAAFDSVAVPEPSAFAWLMGLGMSLGLCFRRCKPRR